MPRRFLKTRECGCIVAAITCGINNDKKYILGGHTHIRMCDKCRVKEEEDDEDTLYDMWRNDNITNDSWNLEFPQFPL